MRKKKTLFGFSAKGIGCEFYFFTAPLAIASRTHPRCLFSVLRGTLRSLSEVALLSVRDGFVGLRRAPWGSAGLCRAP